MQPEECQSPYAPCSPMRRQYPSFQSLCSPHCPNLPRITELQNELAYYKSRCDVFESHLRLARQSAVRISCQQVNGPYLRKCSEVPADKLEQVQISRHSKDQLIEFSHQIQEKMRANQRRKSLRAPKSTTRSVSSGPINAEQESSSNEGHQDVPDKIPMSDVRQDVLASRLISRQPKQEPSLKIPTPTVSQRLISDLCIFGLKSSTVANFARGNESSVTPGLVHSVFNLFDSEYYNHIASTYLFPHGPCLKKIRKQKFQAELEHIILQAPKRQTNFIYAFQSKSTNFSQMPKQQLELLNEINPQSQRKLYCISLLLNEFTMANSTKQHQKSTTSLKHNQATQMVIQPKQEDTQQKKSSTPIKVMYSSRRLISIFSFYPFFQFFQSILITFLNEFKLQRMNIFQRNLETAPQIDSQFIQSRISDPHFLQMVQVFNNAKMVYNLRYMFEMAGREFVLNTTRSEVPGDILGGWIWNILRMFNKDTLYETICAILFEESVVFVSENLHILTYTIYLFTEILFRPYTYPHPVLYIIPDESWLHAITPVVMGVNRSSKWIDQYYNPETQTKLFIYLGQQAILRDKVRRPKSQKLRKIIRQYYRPYDRGFSFFKKKDGSDSSHSVSKQQRQASLQLVNQINYFFELEFVREMPDRQTIPSIRSRIQHRVSQEKHDEATLISQQVQKEIIRGKRDRDPFVEKFLKSQIFLKFLFERIGFDE